MWYVSSELGGDFGKVRMFGVMVVLVELKKRLIVLVNDDVVCFV